MEIDLTKRGVLTMFFRRRAVFFFVFMSVVLCTVAYIVLTTPLYSASGSLLIKFGANASPDVSNIPDNNRNAAPEEDHASALESNIELIKSRSLLRDIVNAFGVETLYPGLTEETAGEDSPLEAAVTRIIKKDLAVKTEQQSDIITLTYMNQDPRLASQFLQRLMDMFIERRAEYYKKPPIEFITQQIKEAADKLAVSQKNLEEFKEKGGLSSLDTELQSLLQEKTDLRNAGLQAIDDARSKLEELKLKESDLLNTYRPNSQIVTDLRRNIHVVEQQLRARQDDLKASSEPPSANVPATENSPSSDMVITGQMTTINHRIAEIEGQRHAYDDLLRQVQIDEGNYKSYVEHGEQARINESLNKDKLTSISIVDNPVVPQKPSYPKKLLFLLVGLLGGLVLAAWSVVVIDHFDDRFTTPEQVSQQLGIPVLASFVAPARIRKA